MSDNESTESLAGSNTEPTVAENTTVEQAPAVADNATTESPAVTNTELSALLSEDIRDQSNLKDFKDANQLAKSYVELQRMVGNSVRIPPADASDEAKKEFLEKIKDVDGVLIKDDEQLLNKLGKPETPDGYKLSEIVQDEMIANIPHLAEELEDFKGIAHDLGLTDQQAQKLVETRMKTLESQKTAMEQYRATAEAELKRDWGADYENRLNAAKQVARIYSEKHSEQMAELINGPAGNNPAFLKILSELSTVYKEKGHEGLSKAQFGTTPDEALAKIADKRSDVGFMKAYHDDLHPGHKKAVSELQQLYRIANGAEE